MQMFSPNFQISRQKISRYFTRRFPDISPKDFQIFHKKISRYLTKRFQIFHKKISRYFTRRFPDISPKDFQIFHKKTSNLCWWLQPIGPFVAVVDLPFKTFHLWDDSHLKILENYITLFTEFFPFGQNLKYFLIGKNPLPFAPFSEIFDLNIPFL